MIGKPITADDDDPAVREEASTHRERAKERERERERARTLNGRSGRPGGRRTKKGHTQ